MQMGRRLHGVSTVDGLSMSLSMNSPDRGPCDAFQTHLRSVDMAPDTPIDVRRPAVNQAACSHGLVDACDQAAEGAVRTSAGFAALAYRLDVADRRAAPGVVVTTRFMTGGEE